MLSQTIHADGVKPYCMMCGRHDAALDENDYCDVCRRAEVEYRNGERSGLLTLFGRTVAELKNVLTEEQLEKAWEAARELKPERSEGIGDWDIATEHIGPAPAQIDAAARQVASAALDPERQGGRVVFRGDDLSEGQWYPAPTPADVERPERVDRRRAQLEAVAFPLVTVPVPTPAGDVTHDELVDTCRKEVEAAAEYHQRRLRGEAR